MALERSPDDSSDSSSPAVGCEGSSSSDMTAPAAAMPAVMKLAALKPWKYAELTAV